VDNVDEEGQLINLINFSDPIRRVVSFTHWNPEFIKTLIKLKIENNSSRIILPKYISKEEGINLGLVFINKLLYICIYYFHKCNYYFYLKKVFNNN